MKKIALIIPHVTGRGGTEKVVAIVMNLLQRKSSPFTPSLYIFGGSENKEWLRGINYDEVNFSNRRFVRTIQNFLFIFMSIYKYVQKEEPEIVISTHSRICFVLYLIRKITRKNYPIVSWVHFSLNARNVKKRYLKYANFHLAICDTIKQQFEENGYSSSRVFVVNNPVKYSNFLVSRPKDMSIFIYVGRIEFEGQKRIKDLLDVLSQLKGEWRLEVFGDGQDYNRANEYAKKLSIDDKIIWRGWSIDPWSTVNEATALVMTSKFEGLPMVLAEAIAHGIYVISSDCETGPRDIINKDVNGELYIPGKLNQLKEILQDIINGKQLPDQKVIQSSINKFYIDNYFDRFINTINQLEKKYTSERKVE